MTPTRPINIKRIKINLLPAVNLLVIPNDSPTVPNADVTSNNISSSVNGSSNTMINIEVNTKINAINVTVTAFIKSESYISRLNNLMLFPPLAYVIINTTTNAKVVVRIPPPALLGEAPINIKKDINNWFPLVKSPTSNVESPPLLVVTD